MVTKIFASEMNSIISLVMGWFRIVCKISAEKKKKPFESDH